MHWKKLEGYQYLDGNLSREQWAWEFLRRNPKYIEDYKLFIQTKQNLENKYGPYSSNNKDAWESDLTSRYFEPEKSPDCTIQEWKRSCLCVGIEPNIYPLETWYAKKWHLKNRMHNPERQFVPEIEFIVPGVKKADYDSLNNYFEDIGIPHSPILPIDGATLLAFNLEAPFGKQLDDAKKILQQEKERQEKLGLISPTKTKEHYNRWKNYLRILDANQEKPNVTKKEIGKHLFPKQSSNSDVIVKVTDTLDQALKQTERYWKILLRTSTK